MAEKDGSVEVWREGTVLSLALGGELNAVLIAETIAKVKEAQTEDRSTAAIVDTGKVERFDLPQDDLYTMVTAMRRRFRPGPGYKCALVVADPTIAALLAEMVRTRDLLVGDGEVVMDIRILDSVDEARSWINPE